jgi:hypothetical protein
MSILSEQFGIDTRGLAAFRIGAGAVILLDLALRAQHLVVFYTDNGVWPRSLNAALFPVLHSLSVHAWFGSASAQVVLFVLAGVAATALLVGYRTTVATTASAALLISLQFRNPLVLTAGDLVLSVLLLFGVALPLGGRYSIDAVHGGSRRDRVSNILTAAPLLFVVFHVYTANAITHLRSEQWTGGEAIKTVFAVDSMTVFLGEVVAGHSTLLATINWIWLVMLVAAPLLVLSSGRLRSSLILLYGGAHLGIFLTLYLVTFPLVNCVALLLFLPSDTWDWVTTGVPEWVNESLTDNARQIERLLYRQTEPSLSDWSARVGRLVGVLVVIVVLLTFTAWGTMTLHPEVDTSNTVPVEHKRYPFAVFSPEPLHTDGWYVAPVTLESGLVVDAYRLNTVSWDRPPDLDRAYPGPRWTTYMIAGPYRVHAAEDSVIEGFAVYLCDRAADHYTPPVENVTVYFIRESSNGTATTRVRIIRRTCQ